MFEHQNAVKTTKKNQASTHFLELGHLTLNFLPLSLFQNPSLVLYNGLLYSK